MQVRAVRESDIEGLVALFRSAYGEDYALREVYDHDALKRGIYSDNIHWLVAEDEGAIVGSGALVMALGDDNDQIGELGRLVVRPGTRSKGLARRLVDALVAATGERVEFAFGESRTVHPYSQRMADSIGMPPVGFMPMAYQMATRESFVVNAALFGNGRALRRSGRARVVEEVAPLARLSLRNLGLDDDLQVESPARGYPATDGLGVAPLDNGSLLRLLAIEQGRLIEPEVFGALHVDQGLSQIRARSTQYFVASEGGRTLGAVGYGWDAHDRNLRISELIGADAGTKGALLRYVVDRAELEHDARLVQCDVSAESPMLQQTLLELGFQPAGYLPGLVFHRTRRIDVVRFLKLAGPWDPGPMELVASSREYYDAVAPGFERAMSRRERAGEWRRRWLVRGYAPSELEVLLHLGSEQTPEAGAALDRAAFFVVLGGELLEGDRARAVGECANAAALFGRAGEHPLSAGSGCRLLAFAGAALSHVVDRYPRLALKLAGTCR